MYKKFRRSRKNQMISGVCAGLAEFMNLDPTLVRIAYVLLSILSVGFPGILIYILMWIIVPLED